ncbi:MAG TPA: hypothetical protein VFV78_06745, partial [Vicinamibacterales bacterium]|nr:hypothetical protein [Vicinamibacterales bacterium]
MSRFSFIAAGACAVAVTVSVAAQQKTPVQVPNPNNPQITTLEDQYVRVAYNNEGYAIMGYRLTQGLVGKEWIRLEVGTTLREGKPRYALKRSDITLDTPDGKHLALPSNAEFQQVDLRGLDQQAAVINDSINYFPPTARGACRLAFFAEPQGGQRAYDVTDIDPTRGCLGRLYFKIPGGLQYGQHFLNIQFATSKVRVPFKI